MFLQSRKFVLASMVFVGASAFAAAPQSYPFFVGLAGSYQMVNFKNTVTSKDTGSTTHENDWAHAIAPSVYGGYTFSHNHVDLQLAANFTYDNTKHTHHGHTHNVTKTFRYNFGVTALPGYQINRYLEPFALVGVQLGSFKHCSENKFSKTHRSTIFNRPGAVVGAGLKYRVNQHWAVNIAYSYAWYKSFKTGESTHASVNKTTLPRVQDIILSTEYFF